MHEVFVEGGRIASSHVFFPGLRRFGPRRQDQDWSPVLKGRLAVSREAHKLGQERVLETDSFWRLTDELAPRGAADAMSLLYCALTW